jgi:pimeloyl-ACP methyl ester carboxylesterase
MADKRFDKRFTVGLLFALALVMVRPGVGQAASITTASPVVPSTVPASLASCAPVERTVGLVPGLPKTETISGTLCVPTNWAPGPHTIDVLVHGGMYNRQYWDWPVYPETYSYVRKTEAAGRAAFFYDRLGAGESSHPAGPRATFNSDAYALHQIVSGLRADYPAVNVIGHSLGSAIVIQEAGQYDDADHVVLTGLTHGHGLGFLTLPTAIYAAVLDPQFAGMLSLLDGGYLTTLPGKRGGLFYSASADPSVIAYDEAHKDVMTGSQTAQAITALTIPPGLNLSNQITAPVLMVDGQEDAPFCNVDVSCASDAVLQAREAPYFTGATSFTARTIPNTGHDLPLHPSAELSFDVINEWLETS